MEGKTITKVLELENGYVALMLDDEEVAIVKVVTPDLSLEELNEFLGESKPPKKEKEEKTKKVKEPEPEDEEPEEEEPEEEEYSWADFEGMNLKALTKLCDEYDLGVDPDDYEKDEIDDLRIAVAKGFGIEPPEEEEEEDEEDDDEEDEDPTDDEYTWDDLAEMDYEELGDLVDEEKLDTDPDDYTEEEEDKLRRAIAKELGIEPPKPKRKK